MRPLQLEVEGLASLRDRQVVDFRGLDTLFAIIGPTGAGKTTTLDAISLALFGQLPRMDRSFRDFMSLGLTRTRVSFDFLVENVHYRVVRTFSRKGNQEASLERIRPDESAYALVEDGGVAGINKKIEEILGLDYETFARVILLPQGDFAQMLQGGAKERRAILTRLLGVGRLERAGVLARERAKDLEGQARVLKDLVGKEYLNVTPENHRKTLDKVDVLDVEIQDASSALGVVRTAVETLQTLESQGVKVAEAGRKLDDMADRCQELGAQWKRIVPDITAAQADKETAAKDLASATENLTRCALSKQEFQARIGNEQTLRDLARDVRDQRRLQDERLGLAARASQAEAEFLRASESYAHAQELVRSMETVEAEEQAKIPKAREAVVEAQAALAQVRGRLKAVATLAAAEAAVGAADLTLAGAESRLDQAQQSLEAARVAREAALKEQHVAALVEHLHSGDDCPVCGHVVETVPQTHNPDIDRATRAVEQAKQAVPGATSALTAAHRAVAEATSLRDLASHALENFPGQIEESVAKEHLRDAESLLRTTLTAAETAAGTHQATIRTASQSNRELGQAMSARTALSEQAATLAEQTASLAERIKGFVGLDENAEPEAWASAQLDEWNRKEREFLGAQGTQADAQQRLLGAIEALGRHEKASHDVERALGVLWERLAAIVDEEIKPLDAPLGEQMKSLCSTVQAEKERAMAQRETIAEQYKAVRAEVRSTLARLKVSVQKEKDAASAVEQHLMAKRDERTRMTAQAERLVEQLTRKFELIREAVTVGAQAERYKQLGNELKGDRFVKYVLDESFQELALGASDELHLLSDGKYSLRAQGDAFVVVDHANADEERSVATLSGGESFMASLALAMALAKGIRDLAGDAAGARLESVFIDEGFGTLDPATLDTVVDGLERLQETGRTIGVITHVADLAERIPSGLEIVPGAHGSTIRNRQDAPVSKGAE